MKSCSVWSGFHRALNKPPAIESISCERRSRLWTQDSNLVWHVKANSFDLNLVSLFTFCNPRTCVKSIFPGSCILRLTYFVEIYFFPLEVSPLTLPWRARCVRRQGTNSPLSWFVFMRRFWRREGRASRCAWPSIARTTCCTIHKTE